MRKSLTILLICVAHAFAAPLPTTQPKPTTMQSPTTQRGVNAAMIERRSNPSGNELSPVLVPAIDTLTAEMQRALNAPEHAVLRTACDYFDKRADTVAPDALLDALTRRLNRDPRIDGYVKWQLLSIQKTAFCGTIADRALQIYLRCPPPPARPGASAIDQRRLTAQIGTLKEADVQAFNQNWDETIRLSDLQFMPLLGFRDMLYARLPKNFDVLRAALLDADQRVQGGYDPKAFLKTVFADTRAWANGASKSDVTRMSDLVQMYATRDPTKRFTEIAYNDKKMSATWHTAGTRFDKKACETLAADLRQIANAGF